MVRQQSSAKEKFIKKSEGKELSNYPRIIHLIAVCQKFGQTMYTNLYLGAQTCLESFDICFACNHSCFLRVYKMSRLIMFHRAVVFCHTSYCLLVSASISHVDSAMQHKYGNYSQTLQYYRRMVELLTMAFKRNNFYTLI